MVPYQVLGGWVISGIMGHHDMWLFTSVQNFKSLAGLEVCKESSALKVNTWRMLMVPDQVLGGWGHP